MNGGVVFATIMLWVVAFVCLISFLLLIKCKDYVVGGFGDIGDATYGRWMRVAVLMSITLSQVKISSNLHAAGLPCLAQTNIHFFFFTLPFPFDHVASLLPSSLVSSPVHPASLPKT
jgi:amino acid permease